MVHFNIKMQNLELVNLNFVIYAKPIPLSLNKVKTKDIDKPVYCLNRANFDQMRDII